MSYFEEDEVEKTFETDWDWTRFAFGICYMYTEALSKSHSLTIEIAFWQIDICW
jgi:hypothetical protein